MQENEEMKQRKKKHLVLTSYPHEHKHLEHRISRSLKNIATQMLLSPGDNLPTWFQNDFPRKVSLSIVEISLLSPILRWNECVIS